MQLTLSQSMKKIKALESKKEYLIAKERTSFTYSYIEGEDAIIPDYDYKSSIKEIDDINNKVIQIKMAINKVNNEAKLDIDNLTISEGLIKMAQLNHQIVRLYELLQHQDISRCVTKSGKLEYTKSMAPISEVRKDYEMYQEQLAALQIALDNANASYTIDVDL